MNRSAGSRPVARPPRFGERLTQKRNCADGSDVINRPSPPGKLRRYSQTAPSPSPSRMYRYAGCDRGTGAIPWPLTAGGSQLTVTASRYGSEHLLQDQECSRLVGVESR